MVEVTLPKDPPMPKHEAEQDMHDSVQRVHELIEDEIAKGIDPDRIVISGFSQGEPRKSGRAAPTLYTRRRKERKNESVDRPSTRHG